MPDKFNYYIVQIAKYAADPGTEIERNLERNAQRSAAQQKEMTKRVEQVVKPLQLKSDVHLDQNITQQLDPTTHRSNKITNSAPSKGTLPAVPKQQ